MAELAIVWQNSTKTAVEEKEIEQHLLDILRRLKAVGRVEIEISIVTDKEIKALKQRFFGVNEPTDVLSFPYEGKIEGLTGSIAISLDTATKQAKTAGIKLIEEVKMLASHGMLHLLEYNHK